MPRSARGVPKEIAAFGERQFNETGAAAVEVLRVKASTIRKYFRQLKGVTFLVAVKSLDRVRVYFFTNAGVMALGENLDHSDYEKVRKTSRLLAKFEKPRELTPEEKRIEATEELRSEFGKALRRVSRYLGVKEPPFPELYVSRDTELGSVQSFGTEYTETGEVVFEESVLNKGWIESLLNRTAFVVFLPVGRYSSEVCSLVGNALSASILKISEREGWLSEWRERSKDTDWSPFVEHFIRHADTYRSNHYRWLWDLLGAMKRSDLEGFRRALRVFHDSCTVPIGTEEYSQISGYCEVCKTPKRILKGRYALPSIHLSPRILALPNSLGVSVLDDDTINEKVWASVSFVRGGAARHLAVQEGGEEGIVRLEYRLDLTDCYPSSGGLVSHGRLIVQRALAALGLKRPTSVTFSAAVEPSESTLNTTEEAVLERLLLGEAEIIENSLVGSPKAVDSLVKKGRIVFVPGFNHLGLSPSFLLFGPDEVVRQVAEANSIESTIVSLQSSAYGLVSSPSTWRSGLLSDATQSGLKIWPVRSTSSSRRLIRDEKFLA
ncbi:hypothetical protein EU546_01905 [Candidatus Thorarchaeota archaeon]|nr:MAG: hypothetical protein EU546_01905 [Candidatus Thorarchaeota archaeon]